MRTNAPPRRRRTRGALSRLLATTALVTAAAVTMSGVNAPALPPVAATTTGETVAFDPAAAASLREAQCRLGLVLRKGGPAMKAVARDGFAGAESDLLAAADEDYWTSTPLSVAFDQDRAASEAKMDELAARDNVWDSQLSVKTPPPGYSQTGFTWAPRDPDIFEQTGLSSWISDQFWNAEDDFYADLTPLAGKESAQAEKALGNSLYPEPQRVDFPDNASFQYAYAAWSAWRWDVDFMHPLYADDARIFLQNGGFPSTAPAADSMEFRLDVEALKARFASCDSTNPVDPHNVLSAEVETASTEWQAEISGQAAQRNTILAAEAQANADLVVASQAMGEALGQSLIAGRLTEWQAYWLKQTPASAGLDYPAQSEFDSVKTRIAQAQARAAGRLLVASRAALSAQAQADKATAAQTAAYAVADAAGLPRGRGLLAAQQAAQVTKASAAAALAASKATETAANATRASAADSKTLMALADTQAHATKAEFRRAAAEEAAAQAKAAADGAAQQAAAAAANATKAKTAQAKAEAAEQTAKDAAADARAKRATAEAERDKAKAEKETAASERAKAAASDATAQAQRQTAAAALSTARSAGATAAEKKDAALAAERTATTARDNALEAESNRDVLTAKAAALEARAAAVEGTDAAADARAAATAARTAADQATAAATAARAAADSATAAASAADAAATRAEADASRAKAASDAAQRDVAITEAAVKKAHAAAADAIAASEAAAANVHQAQIDADNAKLQSTKARADAASARNEADAAHADAVRTAGYAYATAQAAVAARDSAAQVIQPANDAVELGSPYRETDASAGLAVLTGQAAKTAAEQQAAVAQAKADQAAKASAEAAALAAAADADAKAAATAAAAAADSAARAQASLAQARASAAQAAAAAAAAQKAEANTVAYDQQANDDAAAAASASDAAAGYAGDARSSADAAEQDAASARSAASAAEDDAATARGVADQAESDADTAEAAAAHAGDLADEAQRAAAQTESDADRQREADRASEAGPTGIANLVSQPSEDAKYDITPLDDVCAGTGSGSDIGCDINLEYHLYGTQDYFLETCPEAGHEIADCPVKLQYDYLGSGPLNVRYKKLTHINGLSLTESVLKSLGLALVADFIGCWRKISGQSGGSVIDCVTAIGSIVIPPAISGGIRYARALRAGMTARAAFTDALFQLGRSGLPAEAIAGLENAAGEALAAGRCFPAGTLVDTEHGPRRIEDVRVGDRVWADDPQTGVRTLRSVTRLFHRTVDSLVQITAASGTVSASDSHRFWTEGRGWTTAADLRPGDRLRSESGGTDRVLAVVRHPGTTDVYNFEVDTDHTYYVYAGAEPVLVHNDCITDVVKAGDHVVLGINPYSDALAAEITEAGSKAFTLNNPALGAPFVNGDGRPIWMVAVTAAVGNPAIKLTVTLDGVEGAKSADEALAVLLKLGESVAPGDWRAVAEINSGLGTAWEMTQIRSAIKFGKRPWSSITWMRTEGGVLKEVFPTPVAEPLPD
ncbi:polymorphic toxin type 27 domain-containing protein [Streptacidiphilus griseoplanus]|uniref:polymorphic toxin type 27 domain-containing protein n=1 Tax=Peterkaempfera griseoplana TaxID=66896 RepID=UPI0006E40350|nr:polymorphic toxin type 27 domain-containing protein [Peterkaempfera griseoplana]